MKYSIGICIGASTISFVKLYRDKTGIVNIDKVLKKAGYINTYDKIKNEKGQQMLEIILKYPDAKRTVITNIKRVSKPGRRVYVASDSIPKVLNGFGISILSTSSGVITDAEARELNVGGEVLCNVW